MTGPFLPAAPSWMWAAVPATPVELMLPETEPSSAIVIVPLPAADVVTGGTSLAPDSVTLTSAASAVAAPRPPTSRGATNARVRKGDFSAWLIAFSSRVVVASFLAAKQHEAVTSDRSPHKGSYPPSCADPRRQGRVSSTRLHHNRNAAESPIRHRTGSKWRFMIDSRSH